MIAAGFCVQFLIWISLVICWGVWMVNANNIDSQFTNKCNMNKSVVTSNLPSCDVSIYDIAWIDGPYPSDTSEDLFKDAEDYCDFSTSSSTVDRNNDCLEKGIRWSVAYKFCFTICLIYMFASLILIAGAWNYHSRVFGGCTFCCAQCLNLAAIITVGVFRFNALGKLAAVS